MYITHNKTAVYEAKRQIVSGIGTTRIRVPITKTSQFEVKFPASHYFDGQQSKTISEKVVLWNGQFNLDLIYGFVPNNVDHYIIIH